MVTNKLNLFEIQAPKKCNIYFKITSSSAFVIIFLTCKTRKFWKVLEAASEF